MKCAIVLLLPHGRETDLRWRRAVVAVVVVVAAVVVVAEGGSW